MRTLDWIFKQGFSLCSYVTFGDKVLNVCMRFCPEDGKHEILYSTSNHFGLKEWFGNVGNVCITTAQVSQISNEDGSDVLGTTRVQGENRANQ